MAIDETRIRELMAPWRRALVGLAHYDNGEKVKGCDCCYCAPEEASDEARS